MKGFGGMGVALSLSLGISVGMATGCDAPASPAPVDTIERLPAGGPSTGHEPAPPAEPEATRPRNAVEQLRADRDRYVAQGVPARALDQTIEYLEENLKLLSNTDYVSIIDFTVRSLTRRFFILDVKTATVRAMYVAHGKGSDPDNTGKVQRFSNVVNSLATSKGFYLVAERAVGETGDILRMDGLQDTNSRARERAIIIHGATYVDGEHGWVGRSHGCPAVSLADLPYVLDTLRGGSLLYAYGN